MIIGVPKEKKKEEYRVGMTPSGVFELISRGHKVLVEESAGNGSGYIDEEYRQAGATIVPEPEEIFNQASLIVKVKEPEPEEYSLPKPGQTIFTYFHFASSLNLTKAMMDSGATCIAYETVQRPDSSLPLLVPMSEIAGRMSVQEGAAYLEKPRTGRGILLGGVPGVPPANVLILGAGTVGTEAAKIAAGMKANVTIMDINVIRLKYLSEIMPGNVTTVYSNQKNIYDQAVKADLIIGSVLIPGAKAPVLISRRMLKDLKKGTVLIDVAVDQGGCIETCKTTTHNDPVYTIDNVVHYCVANMPGAVPVTSTQALTNVTLPYIIKLANEGWQNACKNLSDLKSGLNIVDSRITNKPLADTFDLPYESPEEFLNEVV